MLLIDLFETRMQRTQLMYHGTSSNLVPSILKFGLVANPPRRTYSRDTDVEQQGYDSYGGVYLSKNIDLAKDAAYTAVKAHGGDAVMITVQYVLTSGTIDEDEITALFLSALIHEFESYSVESMAGQIKQHRPTIERDLLNLIVNYKTRSMMNYHPTGEIKFTPDAVAQFKTIISTALDALISAAEDTPNTESSYYIEYYLLPKLRYNTVYDHAMMQLFKLLRSRNPTTVRVTRNIGFKGKTRILSIQNLETKQILYGAFDANPKNTTAIAAKVNNKLRKDSDYYFFGNPDKGYAWGIGRTSTEAMDDAEEQFDLWYDGSQGVEWEDELQVCRVYPTDKQTYDAIEQHGAGLKFEVKKGLVVVKGEQ
jgi:hypothetical protein